MKPDLPYLRQDMATPARWNSVSDYFHYFYGERVQKIPLDAGFSCPNRDGTLSASGCVFCNPVGSGTGLGLQGLDILSQWRRRCEKPKAKGVRLFLAYLQSFSNTYGPVAKLAAVLEELKGLPGIIGLAVGTRPDCVDAEKLELIANTCKEQKWSECWLELGVQSSSNLTLERINRGHDIESAEKAITDAERAGLKVCIHLIAGLPGESPEDFVRSVQWASSMPVHGIKFHCLYVCRSTKLACMYEKGHYSPWTQQAYISAMLAALPCLRRDIVIQRITAQPGRDELLAPEWAAKVLETSDLIRNALANAGSWQGKDCPG